MGCVQTTENNTKIKINPTLSLNQADDASDNSRVGLLQGQAGKPGEDRSLFQPEDLGGSSLGGPTSATTGAAAKQTLDSGANPDASRVLFPEDGEYVLGGVMTRTDLSKGKIPQTPKNHIEVIKLTDQIIKFFEDALKNKKEMKQKQDKHLSTDKNDDESEAVQESEINSGINSSSTKSSKGTIAQFKDMLMSNTFKMQNNIDEVSYCQYMASQHIIHFNQNSFFVDLILQTIYKIREKVKEFGQNFVNYYKQGGEVEPTWYLRYSITLSNLLWELAHPLRKIQESGQQPAAGNKPSGDEGQQPKVNLLKDYVESQEMLYLYGSLLATVRFMEGISWGYSPMFMHETLDKQIVLAIKVVVNHLLMLRQTFRENQHLSEILNQKDILASYWPRETFQTLQDYDQLENMIIFHQNSDQQDLDANLVGVDSAYCESSYLTSQVFRKTYVQIKRSIDEWLRVKNLSKLAVSSSADRSESRSPAISSAKEGISVQELVCYRLQYRSFTKNQIRSLKRPSKFPSRRQRNSQMQSHNYTYSSVNMTQENGDGEEGVVGMAGQAGKLSFQIIPSAQGSSKNHVLITQNIVPCSYDIENSKQIIVLTGESHEELRVIVESFLQANMKIRTKYKCCVLHHCCEENAASLDTYFIVKNIMRQILHTLPVLGEYLQISDSSSNEFTQVIREIMHARRSGETTKTINSQYMHLLTEHNYPQIFVKFIKKINELKLDFNIVIAITGIEFVYDDSHFQNIVYLLRSASVYLNQNSFLKFILTLKKQDPQHQNKRKGNDQTDQTDEDPTFEGCLAKDQAYQDRVQGPAHAKHQNIIKILQTGAICQVDDAVFFKKDGSIFLEFATRYLYQEKFGAEVEKQKRAQLQEVAAKGLELAGGSYHNSIDIAKHLVDFLKAQDKDKPVEPSALLQGYKPRREKAYGALQGLANKVGFCSAISIVSGLIQLCRDPASNVIPYDSVRGLVHLEGEYLRQASAFKQAGGASTFFDFVYNSLEDFEGNGVRFHFATLLQRKHQLYSLVEEFATPQPPETDTVSLKEVLELLEPILITLKSKHCLQFHSTYASKVSQDGSPADLLSAFQAQFLQNREKFDELSVMQKQLGIGAYLSLRWLEIDKALKDPASKQCSVFQVRDLALLEDLTLRLIHAHLPPEQMSSLSAKVNQRKPVSQPKEQRSPNDFDALPELNQDSEQESPDGKPKSAGSDRVLSLYGLYEHFKWVSLDAVLQSKHPNLQKKLADGNPDDADSVSLQGESLLEALLATYVLRDPSQPAEGTASSAEPKTKSGEPLSPCTHLDLIVLHRPQLVNLLGQQGLLHDFINMHNTNQKASVLRLSADLDSTYKSAKSEAELPPVHRFFTKNNELLSDGSAKKESKRSQEPLWSYLTTYGVSIPWLFRADAIYVLIKDVFQSFNRYVEQLRGFCRTFLPFADFATTLQNRTVQTQRSNSRIEGFKTVRDNSKSLDNGHFRSYSAKLPLIQDFVNFIINMEETLTPMLKRGEPFDFGDFLTQLRGRVLKQRTYLELMDIPHSQDDEGELDKLLQTYAWTLGHYRKLSFFQTYHHALRENQRIEMVTKLPGCLVLAVKFYCKNIIFLSLSNGLIMQYDTSLQEVISIFANKVAIIDCLKVLNTHSLMTAGIDSKIRIWNIKAEKLHAKFEIHKYATQQLIVFNQTLYSYGGHDMKLVKFDIYTKETDCWINLKSHITALKLLKYRSRGGNRMGSEDGSSYQGRDRNGRMSTTESEILSETRIAAAFHDFDVVLYDLDLNQLQQLNLTNMTPGDEVIRMIRSGDHELMCFSNEGTINVLSTDTLDELKSGSIFSLKNEDYIDLLLIKSREYFLFTIERQKIEFYSAQQLKRTDSWDFFFQSDIICCDKNKEGSKILIGDKACGLIMFNFMKYLDTSKDKQVPANRRQDPVVSIEITSDPKKSEADHLILSCSQDRDLRIWNRADGLFNKKYDLSSFLGENVQCIKLGKNEDNLFLGSKDMNVYLINIQKGKLCVVYEGHWNKVTSIYAVPRTDILVTVSESNIKVWDLEYDECIKNMNEHSSVVVYIEQLAQDEQQVMTIGEQFELKVWNYVTGRVTQQHQIDLEKDRRSLRNLSILACHVQDNLAYLALSNNEICIYSVAENSIKISFSAWQNEEVIFIRAIKTLFNSYLLVVYRSSALLYQVVGDTVRRVSQYSLNCKKSQEFKGGTAGKYQNNSRFYFTSARLQVLFDEELLGQYQALLAHLSARGQVASLLLSIIQNPEEADALLYQIDSRVPHETVPKDTLLMDSELDPIAQPLTVAVGEDLHQGVADPQPLASQHSLIQHKDEVPVQSHTDMSISKNSYGVGKGPNYGSDVKAITKQPITNNALNDEPALDNPSGAVTVGNPEEVKEEQKADKVLYRNQDLKEDVEEEKEMVMNPISRQEEDVPGGPPVKVKRRQQQQVENQEKGIKHTQFKARGQPSGGSADSGVWATFRQVMLAYLDAHCQSQEEKVKFIQEHKWVQHRILKYLVKLKSKEDNRREQRDDQGVDQAFRVLVCLGDSKGQIHMNNLWLQ